MARAGRDNKEDIQSRTLALRAGVKAHYALCERLSGAGVNMCPATLHKAIEMCKEHGLLSQRSMEQVEEIRKNANAARHNFDKLVIDDVIID